MPTPQIAGILHADLDAFYASVEQRDDPTLAGKPVGVGGGIITAVSYEARSYGVRAPINEREARRRCPGLLVVPPRMDAYAEASREVFDIFKDTSPLVEGLSIDEAFIDVRGLIKLKGAPVDLAQQLRTRVRNEVRLPLSIGVATTKFLAKVASAASKPDGLLVVEAGKELDFLHPLPVEALWGVGPKTAAKLRGRGLERVADIAHASRDELVAMLGNATGHHLYALAHNEDYREVQTNVKRKSIGSQRAFPAGNSSRDHAETILLETVEGMCNRLRNSNQLGRTVTLRLRYGDFRSATRSHTFTEATESTQLVLRTAQQLLDGVWAEVEQHGLTKVGVAISNLEPADAAQLALPIGEPSEGELAGKKPERESKVDRAKLDQAIDAARDRFGYDAVSRAKLTGRESAKRAAGIPMLDE